MTPAPTCRQGHPKTPDNRTTDGKCRTCHNETLRRYRYRRKVQWATLFGPDPDVTAGPA